MRTDGGIIETGGETAPQRLRRAFLGWQCRVRQIMFREAAGRPDPGILPEVTLAGEDAPIGQIITVLCRTPRASMTPELRQMARRTNDPAQRREAALRLFSETYFQRPGDFSDMLTASFAPGSPGAERIRAAERCRLGFAAYRQRYDLACRVWRLDERHPAFAATWWHNLLFNPGLPPDAVILGFEPDWTRSSADPDPP